MRRDPGDLEPVNDLFPTTSEFTLAESAADRLRICETVSSPHSTSKHEYEKTRVGGGDGGWGLEPVYDLLLITKGCQTNMRPTIELSPHQRQDLHKHVA